MTEVNEVNFSKGGKMAEGEGGKSWRGMIRMIVTGVVAIVVLAVIAGGIYWYFILRKSDEQTARAGGKAGGQTGDAGTESIENPLYLDLGSFTVNLAQGRRYLKISMQLLMTDKVAYETLKTRVVEVKDIVVSVLRQETVESLNDPRNELDQKILTRLGKLLPQAPKEYRKLLITEFLIQ